MLGSRMQVSRALKALTESGKPVRIGTGIYAKARRSPITGALIPAGSLEKLAMEALMRLGVEYGTVRDGLLLTTTPGEQHNCQASLW